MHYSSVLAILAFVAFSAVKAQEVSNEDIESECQQVCSSVVTIAASCDADDDERELNCICSADGAQQSIPLCEACIASVGDEDGDDVGDLRRSCSFSSTTYTSGAMAFSTMPPSTSAVTTPAMTSSGSTTTTNEANSGTTSTDATQTSSGNSNNPDLAAGPAASVPGGDEETGTAEGGAAATAMPVLGAGAGIALVALGML